MDSLWTDSILPVAVPVPYFQVTGVPLRMVIGEKMRKTKATETSGLGAGYSRKTGLTGREYPC